MSWPPTSPRIGWGHHRLHPTRASSLIIPQDISGGEDETSSVSVFAVHASSPSSAGETDRVKRPDKCAVWNFPANQTIPLEYYSPSKTAAREDSGSLLCWQWGVVVRQFPLPPATFCHVSFFGDHRKEENRPLHCRCQSIINRSHLSFVSTPKYVNMCEV